jgi:transposase
VRETRYFQASSGVALKEQEMRAMHERCAGLDVHQKTVVACVLSGPAGSEGEPQRRTFTTVTAELLKLGDWLAEQGVTHVAMESSGVYWKPVWAVLEGRFDLTLANAAHIKNVPGRKTDQKDAEWIADLLRHGLIKKSFVPPVAVQDLRELTRYRAKVTEDRSAVGNRIRKLLEGANIKLGSVASDVMGVSGQRMLDALVCGETDPGKLADLAIGQLRKKQAQLEMALDGRVREHHRRMLRLQLANWRFLDRLTEELDVEIDHEIGPLREAEALVATLPGVSKLTARSVVAEIGADMSQFPTTGDFSGWSGVCPGNNESAGKHYSGKTRRGNPWLKRSLCQAAWAASHTRNTYFSAQFRRLAAKRGAKRAVVAVAHSMLTAIYVMLKQGKSYQELGADYFEKLHSEDFKRYLVRKLEGQGYKVTLQAAA